MSAPLPIQAEADLAALAKEKDRRLSRERTRRRVEERLAAGLCRDCARPVEASRTGARRCARCQQRDNDAAREHQKARRDRLRAQGVCTTCGNAPAVVGRVTCAACLARDREREAAAYHADVEAARARGRGYYAKAAKRGLCPRCRGRYGKPEQGSKVCAVCRLDTRLAKQRAQAKHP